VRLAVAVRAEQDALGELGFGLRPASGDPIVRDRELLRSRVHVMELEQWLRYDERATETATTQQGDSTTLRLAPRADEGVVIDRRGDEMTPPMAVRAQQVALGSLRPDPRRHGTHATQGEVLRSSVTVVELKSRGRAIVVAVLAPSTSRCE